MSDLSAHTLIPKLVSLAIHTELSTSLELLL